jgi:hypothetical protein
MTTAAGQPSVVIGFRLAGLAPQIEPSSTGVKRETVRVSLNLAGLSRASWVNQDRSGRGGRASDSLKPHLGAVTLRHEVVNHET